MKLTKKAMILPAASLLLLSGCGLLNTPQRSEYAAFAQAGAGYAEAVDQLLVAAGEAQVDSTSWTLVADNGLSKVSDEIYRMKTDADLRRLDVIRKLRSHAKVLALYFGKLSSLATSDAPEKTSASVDGVVKNLTELSTVLRASAPKAFSSLSPLAKLTVNIKIRQALREELEKRNDIIREELRVQEVLLGELESQISDALSLAKEIRERKVVVAPIQTGSPLEKPEEWVEKRREVVYLQEQVAELSSARQLSINMNKVFDDLLSGKDDIGRINALINEIESVLSVAKSIKSGN